MSICRRHVAPAIAVATLLLAACGTTGDQGAPSTEPIPTRSPSTAPASSAPVETTTPSTSADSMPDEMLAEASAVFETWVAALADGDLDGAWALVSPESQAIGRDTFDGMRSGLAEGWGAWTHADDVMYSLSADASGRDVLVIEGVVSQEGVTEARSVEIPLVSTDSSLLLSPFEDLVTG